ncbi:MAG: hypothetical protein QW103_01220 [Candidatus Pacearchaeota archaeon]
MKKRIETILQEMRNEEPLSKRWIILEEEFYKTMMRIRNPELKTKYLRLYYKIEKSNAKDELNYQNIYR